MNLADRLSLTRVILAPVFFAVYTLPKLVPLQFAGSDILMVTLLWVLFIAAQLTDLFDGMAARRLNQTSDFGKLFDPFADTLMQVTIFLCFVIDGIFPAFLYLLVLYREFGILLVRNLMLKKGVAMGARMGGKIKTVTYIAAGSIALLYASLNRIDWSSCFQSDKAFHYFDVFSRVVYISANVVFGVSVLFSILSFFDYVKVYRSSITASKGE